ncbi:MAG: IS66 family transposase [Thermoguttaceae bacterium]
MAQHTPLVNDAALEALLHCRYKAYLTINNTVGEPSDFERHCAAQRIAYCQLVEGQWLSQHQDTDVLKSPPLTVHTLQKGKPLILNAKIRVSHLSATIDAIQRVTGTSPLGEFLYQPIQLCYHDVPTRAATLLLAFKSLAIGELQGHIPSYGTIIFGPTHSSRRVKLFGLQKRVRQLIATVQAYSNPDAVPPRILNQHCSVCEYRTRCRNEAIASDDLSLLGGMTEREIAAQNRKGIFTVNQLSYTYRYRKPSKRAKRPPKPHQFSLQALALRTQKVHVHGTPRLPPASPAIYYDIEGLPNPDFYYLIGMLVVHQNRDEYHTLWADSEEEQASIFEKFGETVSSFPDAHLFHFGSYDATALKRARRICQPQFGPILERFVKASTNVLTLVSSQIYFPIHSNSLKDIATYLGFKWTDSNATGIQSIIWREQWKQSGDLSLKRRLIKYNQDDCAALKTICDFIHSTATTENQPALSGAEQSSVIHTSQLAKASRRWGRPTFVLKDLERASECAYFDYQRERVFLRTNRRIASIERAKKRKARKLRVNKRIDLVCKRCSHCNSRKIKPCARVRRRVADLRFSPGGVKRWVVEYVSNRYLCKRCRKTFLPAEWPESRKRHGDNLARWCVYLNFACRENMSTVGSTLYDLFGINIDRNRLYGFKRQVIASFTGLYEEIRQHILASPVLHIDETDVAIRKTKGYVWIFATLDAVWYLYKESRSGDFLKEMLADFHGVLISDFYSAYDSIDCPQQKCLLHLLRDFNDDLKNSPFDEEFKEIAGEFGRVLRGIIDTIDRYGLKKRHLHKHRSIAIEFIERVRQTPFGSEVALRYQKRFRKYGDRLFTFLDFDGVPWNNNSAEHAAKSFAKYKRTGEGLFTEHSLNEALVMLSVVETCRYNGRSLLRFLLSGKTGLDAVMKRWSRSSRILATTVANNPDTQ